MCCREPILSVDRCQSVLDSSEPLSNFWFSPTTNGLGSSADHGHHWMRLGDVKGYVVDVKESVVDRSVCCSWGSRGRYR
eukprot:1192706-Prorocentrum_minimum.AAC.3